VHHGVEKPGNVGEKGANDPIDLTEFSLKAMKYQSHGFSVASMMDWTEGYFFEIK